MTFSTHIRPETAFLLEIQKTNVRIRISTLEIPGVPIFNQNEQVCFFLAQICRKIDLGFEIHKTNMGKTISIVEISCVPIFSQNGQLSFFFAQISTKIDLGLKIRKLMLE